MIFPMMLAAFFSLSSGVPSEELFSSGRQPQAQVVAASKPESLCTRIWRRFQSYRTTNRASNESTDKLAQDMLLGPRGQVAEHYHTRAEAMMCASSDSIIHPTRSPYKNSWSTAGKGIKGPDGWDQQDGYGTKPPGFIHTWSSESLVEITIEQYPQVRPAAPRSSISLNRQYVRSRSSMASFVMVEKPIPYPDLASSATSAEFGFSPTIRPHHFTTHKPSTSSFTRRPSISSFTHKPSTSSFLSTPLSTTPSTHSTPSSYPNEPPTIHLRGGSGGGGLFPDIKGNAARGKKLLDSRPGFWEAGISGHRGRDWAHHLEIAEKRIAKAKELEKAKEEAKKKEGGGGGGGLFGFLKGKGKGNN